MFKKFRFYKGKPVKRMRRGQYGIILTFVSATRGVPGRQQTITQELWDQHGEYREIPAEQATMDCLRRLAADNLPNS